MSVVTEDHLFSSILGYKVRINGVIHVGANDGDEVPWYLEHSEGPVLCFEPHPAAFARGVERFKDEPRVRYVNCALGDQSETLLFHVPADGDDEKTSSRKAIPTKGHRWTRTKAGESIAVPVMTFGEWAARSGFRMYPFNFVVVDPQGMSMEVLRGFGTYLNYVDLLSVELSETPIFEGETPAAEVVEWLEREFRLHRRSDVKEHDDVLFCRW